MEDSTAENARSRGLTRLHEMVMGVKSDREVGLAYMKWYEIEKRIQEQKNLDILREWHKLAAHSRSIEEFERLILKVPLG